MGHRLALLAGLVLATAVLMHNSARPLLQAVYHWPPCRAVYLTLRLIVSSRTLTQMPHYTIVSGGAAMIPHHVCYQLAILGWLWLCIMLHSGWPSRSTASHPKPSQPVASKGKRTRANEPKTFALNFSRFVAGRSGPGT